MNAVQLIIPNFPFSEPHFSAHHALAIMSEYHVQHLAVVSAGKLAGVISEEEIISQHDQQVQLQQILQPLQHQFAYSHDHLFEVLKVLHLCRLSSIAVVDKEQHFLGTITREKLIAVLCTETDILESGGILVVEISSNDFMLHEIVRIIESCNIKVLACFAGTSRVSGKVDVTFKLNQTNLQPAVEALERHQFHVKELYREPEFFDNLKERYEALMNYLNI